MTVAGERHQAANTPLCEGHAVADVAFHSGLDAHSVVTLLLRLRNNLYGSPVSVGGGRCALLFW